MARDAQKPLDGTLVVSMEQAVAAPYCSSRLAEAGARVIKVERPEGDFARAYDTVVHGESAYFVWLNRGKESLTANIKDEVDRDLLYRVLDKSDVFIQNLAPGAAARAGFDSDELRKRNPRLITVDISGYGEEGSYADMKAYDLLVQAESGLCSITGLPEGPGRVGVSACDVSCGMYSYMAVLEALIARDATGVGSSIKTSLFAGIADWMTVPLLHYDYGEKIMPRVGLNHPSIHPYGAYDTRGGGQILIAIQNEREFSRLCETVLLDGDLPEDPRFKTNEARCANRAEFDAILENVFNKTERNELVRRLRDASIAFGEVNDVAGLSDHPALRRVTVETPSGPVDMVAPPALVDNGVRTLGDIPPLGAHTEVIRKEFGQ
ncbi:MAG: Acetyl-CoA:oxalate CoA-transferase [Alphaproteobacteria bacterium MarineAlpha11_Bin1]|nr:MAG: Acetyl-CoA:oxalate CoA-transferase [Alphaproteobacteria bacterium MarineAlpha11_Bin1]|tara:strand:+ start:4004 stop:5140 length:1137 start_codon:yes stop_codon:yes gene_type:complete